MIRALFSGISGMKNHQMRIDVIGNNIANVNTTGFKYSRVNFQDQVSQLQIAATAPGGSGNGKGGVNPKQVGLGSLSASVDVIHTQGNLQNTGKATDLSITGDGFFVLGEGNNRSYSRAGVFDFDREGSLVNPANGLHVLGYQVTKKLDQAGEPVFSIDTTAPIKELAVPSGAVIAPRATTGVIFKGNLDHRLTTVPPNTPQDPPNFFDSSVEVFDSLGNQHFVTFRYTHLTAASAGTTGQWKWEVVAPNDTTLIQNTFNNPTPPNPANNLLEFGSNGLLIDRPTPPAAPSPGVYDAGSVSLQWQMPDGSITSTTLFPAFGNENGAAGVTQFATESSAVMSDQNGFTRGELTGVNIDKAGLINGVFTNGRTQLLGQIALATFSNPGGLQKDGENGFIRTTNSGDPVVRAPGQAEAGTIIAGTLEMSNVDLAEQFADMIITQRGFQANSRVITTSDEILQELINLKR